MQVRRTRHTGHGLRNKYKLISDLLWTPSYERANTEQPSKTYIQQLCVNVALNEDLLGTMDESGGGRGSGRSTKAV